jgi:hypothetical protein
VVEWRFPWSQTKHVLSGTLVCLCDDRKSGRMRMRCCDGSGRKTSLLTEQFCVSCVQGCGCGKARVFHLLTFHSFGCVVSCTC